MGTAAEHPFVGDEIRRRSEHVAAESAVMRIKKIRKSVRNFPLHASKMSSEFKRAPTTVVSPICNTWTRSSYTFHIRVYTVVFDGLL